MSAYREWTDSGFTSLKWSDIVGDTDIDSYDIFDKLNESFDNTLIGKQIWFDFPTKRNDIEKVNQFLICTTRFTFTFPRKKKTVC